MSECLPCIRAKKLYNESKDKALAEAEQLYKDTPGFWLVLSINTFRWQHRAHDEPTAHFPEREYYDLS